MRSVDKKVSTNIPFSGKQNSSKLIKFTNKYLSHYAELKQTVK